MGEEFLQSEAWLRLQEATGKKTIPFSEAGFLAHGIVHTLPLVGQYLYVPRGPIVEALSAEGTEKRNIQKLILLAKEKKMNWIRIEPETEELLEANKRVTKGLGHAIAKAPHDMQPREVLRIDLAASEAELLSAMKSKTRYNIRLAEKRGVKVFETREEKYIDSFLDLITATSGRKGITSHPRSYYQKFFDVLPEDMCQLFVAEYDGRVVASNLMIVYGGTVTYLHGGSSDADRDVMAPYLLQWEQVKWAKALGRHTYDFGGVRMQVSSSHQNSSFKIQAPTLNPWAGITKFKTGFSPATKVTEYPGSHDIILDARSYFLYRRIQALKHSLFSLKKRLS